MVDQNANHQPPGGPRPKIPVLCHQVAGEPGHGLGPLLPRAGEASGANLEDLRRVRPFWDLPCLVLSGSQPLRNRSSGVSGGAGLTQDRCPSPDACNSRYSTEYKRRGWQKFPGCAGLSCFLIRVVLMGLECARCRHGEHMFTLGYAAVCTRYMQHAGIISGLA
jgi:hypothetical protein